MLQTQGLFEVRGLVVGAVVGAVGFWLLHRQLSGLALGAAVGASTVLGARLVNGG